MRGVLIRSRSFVHNYLIEPLQQNTALDCGIGFGDIPRNPATRMSKVEHLEQEVRELSTEELTTFREWFVAFDAMEWDERIQRDALAGKLNRSADEAIADHQTGRSRKL